MFRSQLDVGKKKRQAKIIIRTGTKWVETRVNQSYNEKQIETLWNNNSLSTTKQMGSNKNEQSHAMKQMLAPLLRTFSHDFWLLLRVIFIWKYNQDSLSFIVKNKKKFKGLNDRWLTELNDLYDYVLSFGSAENENINYEHLFFTLDSNRDKLSVNYCQQNKLLKCKGKQNKWSTIHDSALIKWMLQHCQKETDLNLDLAKKCKQQTPFKSFDVEFLYKKIALEFVMYIIV